MSRYGSKPPDALPDGVVTIGGRYGKQLAIKLLKPVILKASIDVNGTMQMKDDRHEVYIDSDHALYVDKKTWVLKYDIDGGV